MCVGPGQRGCSGYIWRTYRRLDASALSSRLPRDTSIPPRIPPRIRQSRAKPWTLYCPSAILHDFSMLSLMSVSDRIALRDQESSGLCHLSTSASKFYLPSCNNRLLFLSRSFPCIMFSFKGFVLSCLALSSSQLILADAARIPLLDKQAPALRRDSQVVCGTQHVITTVYILMPVRNPFLSNDQT